MTLTGADTAVKPVDSVARAVKLTVPEAEGIQEKVYGAEKAVPTTVVPARKSTFVIVAPELGAASALSETFDPNPTAEPFAGVVRPTVGPNPLTVTRTRGDVAVLRLGVVPVVTTEVSVTVAVRVYAPADVGNQVIE